MAKRSSKTVTLGVLPVLATAFLASCGDDDETAYCTDVNNVVVENNYCDDDFNNGGYYWAFIGGGSSKSYVKGSKITKSVSKIAASNKSALSAKGGFGSKSSSSGVGRASASSHSGGG
ncbi:MAG: hypothetical protein Q7T55_17900 [Solirubrobacteraceae bacterium]|nr:hypothetical protein [Solirubrobacteraceae bacterium]